MNTRYTNRSTRAVSGVIEALLLVALVAIVISTIQLVYVPQIMEQREAEHMDEVSNQFSYLKSMIDIQIATKSDAPIFSMITLGSRELPYLVSARAFGQLSIPQSDLSEILVGADPNPYYVITAIKYEAYNSYFIDQTYILEGGGIVLDQPDGEPVMRVSPQINYNMNTTAAPPKIDIHFSFPNVIGVPNKDLTYGYGKCLIRSNYSGSSNVPPVTRIAEGYFRIYTLYANAWFEAVNETIGDLVTVTMNTEVSPNYVEVRKKDVDIGLYIKEHDIYAQIGPGWVI